MRARSVLLATGVTNRRPKIPVELHDEALSCGLLRYCPICDGFEVTDTRVAVIGTGSNGLREAIFLRSFTADVTLNGKNYEIKVAEDGTLLVKKLDQEEKDEKGDGKKGEKDEEKEKK